MKSPTPRPKSTCPKSGKDHQHLANRPPSEQSNLARRGQRLHQGRIHLQKSKALTRARPFFDDLCVAFFGLETIRKLLQKRGKEKLSESGRQVVRVAQTPETGIEVPIRERGELIPARIVVKNEAIGKPAIARAVVTKGNATGTVLMTRGARRDAISDAMISVLTIRPRGIRNADSLHARATLGIQTTSRAKNAVPKKTYAPQLPAKFMKADVNRDAIDIQLPAVQIFRIPMRCQKNNRR